MFLNSSGIYAGEKENGERALAKHKSRASHPPAGGLLTRQIKKVPSN